jgi:hypothetical protein
MQKIFDFLPPSIPQIFLISRACVVSYLCVCLFFFLNQEETCSLPTAPHYTPGPKRANVCVIPLQYRRRSRCYVIYAVYL